MKSEWTDLNKLNSCNCDRYHREKLRHHRRPDPVRVGQAPLGKNGSEARV